MEFRLENTLEKWIEIKRYVEKEIPFHRDEDDEFLVFKVKVTEENLTNLIYAFPVIDSARIHRWQSKLNLVIDKTNTELILMASHFLCIQSFLREGLIVLINNEKVHSQTRFGKIQPLIAVTNRFGNFDFQKLYTPDLSFDILNDLRPILIRSLIHEENGLEIWEALLKVLDNYSDIISASFYEKVKEIVTKHTPKTIPWSSLFKIDDADSINTVFCKFIISNIIYMTDKFIGTPEKPISKSQKEELFGLLIDYFNCINSQMSLLSLYFWSVLIRFILDSKRLTISERNPKSFLQPVMDATAYRAISFGETLYQLIENACFHSSVHTGYFYFRVYGKGKGYSFYDEETYIKDLRSISKVYTSSPTQLLDSELYLELCFIDNAFDGAKTQGMIDHFNITHSGQKATSLMELFNLPVKNEEDLTDHYGLRVFERNVTINNGAFYVSTPISDEKYSGNIYKKQLNRSPESEKQANVYNGTIYQVLIPIILDMSGNPNVFENDSNGLFNTDSIIDQIRPYCITLNTMPVFSNIEEKKKCVINTKNELENSFPKEKDLPSRIICIQAPHFSSSHVEILAKALIKVLLKRKNISAKIALMFDEDYKIYEFIRVFSAFYDKHGGNYIDFELTKAEIALCRFTESSREVCFVLKGDNLSSVFITARSFVYYHSDSLMKMVPVVSYLTDLKSDNNPVPKKVFPFDLYLDIDSFEDYDNNKPEVNEEKTWFFDRITDTLNKDMQFSGHGCKIPDVHVSIGSKIHINTFYNAEVLFHNFGNIFRFAYLVAKDLILEHKGEHDKEMVLVAYGEYSLMLIQTVCDIINDSQYNLKARYLIFPSYLNEDEIKSRDSQTNEFQSFIDRHNISDGDGLLKYCFHIIIPVSTTLTTVTRIQNAIKRVALENNLNPHIDFGKNLTLVLVGGVTDNMGINSNYWESVQKLSKRVVIQQSSSMKDQEAARTVRYYFNTQGEWYKACEDQCELCKKLVNETNRKVLIGVDKTSTLPSTIFDSMIQPRSCFEISNKAENDRRISYMMGALRYSHMSKTNNHFLYDIDYDKYTENDKTRSAIIKWINDKLVDSIDHSAFNIVVSPLHKANSFFLKAVVNYGFKGSCRIINLKFHDSYRDEIRSRLEFITDEYKQLKTLGSDVKIHTYFVDDCIIEGSTLQRSKQFLYLLFNDSGMDLDSMQIYKGIILLANRSSYDTIQNLLPGRVEKDFHYFVRLNVPSFNTKNGKCPACDLAEKYLLTHKQSSTFLLADEYKRLHIKHSSKNDYEYNKWVDEDIKKNDRYLYRFMHWLYYSVFINDKGYFFTDINGNINKFAENDGTILTEYSYFEFLLKDFDIKRILDGHDKPDFKSYFSPERLIDSKELARRLSNLSTIIRRHIIDEHSFERMVCTHETFMKMESVLSDSVAKMRNTQEYEKLLREAVLIIISDRFKEIEKQERKYKLNNKTVFWLKAEWMISYIKIISRKQPGAYYHLRNAIYNIITDVLDRVLFGVISKSDIGFLAEMCLISPGNRCGEKPMPDMAYRLFITFVRRVSAMYSPYVLKNINEIYKWYEEYEKELNGVDEYANFYDTEKNRILYKNLITVPQKPEFEFTIAKLIKWCSTYGLDESKCFVVEKTLTEQLSRDIPDKNGRMIAYLENTSVIYSGIRKLTLDCVDILDDYDKTYKYVKDTLDAAVEKDSPKKEYYELNPHKMFLQFMDNRKHFLSGYDKIVYRIYTNQVLLFNRLCELEARTSHIDNPYDYVQICNYIRNITRYRQCLIVSGKEGNCTVAKSDTWIDYMDNDLSQETIYDIIKKYLDTRKKYSINAVVQKYSIKSTTEILIIPMTFDENYSPGTYLLLYKGEIKQGEVTPTEKLELQDLWNIRNIMFLRDRLERVLSRDIEHLHNMIDSYSFINNISGSGTAKIMHISDLHITVENESNKKDLVKKLSISETPDLLLITGDVITGRYSAASMINAYNSAERVIKELVKKIWLIENEDGKHIRSDWRKRIIISPGNHDYASMNELEAQNKKRITMSGTPGELGDIMVKHSYFVEFVHNLLGTDIDKLVQNEMNRIYNYDNLKITVANLNSNSNVNPLRTNKVMVNETGVENMFKHSNKNPVLVYMIHHTPMYEVDYVDDVYYLSYKDIPEIKRIMERHSLSVSTPKEVNNVWISLLKSTVNDFKDDVKALSDAEQKCLLKDILNYLKENNEKQYSENNLDDFHYYAESETPQFDDRCRHLKCLIDELIYSTEQDRNQYKDFCIKHFSEKRKEKDINSFYILGGHTHEARVLERGFCGVLDKCEGIYEAGLFLEGTLNYYVLTINQDLSHSFTYYGEKPKPKNLDKSLLNDIMNPSA